MKRLLLAVALGLFAGGAAQAAVIDLSSPARDNGAQRRIADLAVAPGPEIVTAPTYMSELPEPEVFAMMLVGLVLLGYRASRDSSEKFK